MSCPRCYNTAITGMLHGCTILQLIVKDRIAIRPQYFNQEPEPMDQELSELIDLASEGVEY